MPFLERAAECGRWGISALIAVFLQDFSFLVNIVLIICHGHTWLNPVVKSRNISPFFQQRRQLGQLTVNISSVARQGQLVNAADQRQVGVPPAD